jgi:hypothetical protein
VGRKTVNNQSINHSSRCYKMCLKDHKIRPMTCKVVAMRVLYRSIALSVFGCVTQWQFVYDIYMSYGKCWLGRQWGNFSLDFSRAWYNWSNIHLRPIYSRTFLIWRPLIRMLHLPDNFPGEHNIYEDLSYVIQLSRCFIYLDNGNQSVQMNKTPLYH